jgi:hypothetical protein
MKSLPDNLHNYLAEIGRAGGRKSRRQLSPEVAREMVRVREARRAFRRYHSRCFWDSSPDFRPGIKDVPWVAERLRKNGGREGWETADRLCR